jgi:ABC-type spermidine/putrescine transport system permease subunit II
MFNYVRRQSNSITNVPILISGIVAAAALQILFSQSGVMNTLFETAPLTWNQWLICLLPMLPMVPVAILVKLIDPP